MLSELFPIWEVSSDEVSQIVGVMETLGFKFIDGENPGQDPAKRPAIQVGQISCLVTLYFKKDSTLGCYFKLALAVEHYRGKTKNSLHVFETSREGTRDKDTEIFKVAEMSMEIILAALRTIIVK